MVVKKIYQDFPDYFDEEMVGYPKTNTSCLNDTAKCIEWLDTFGSDKLHKKYIIFFIKIGFLLILKILWIYRYI